MRIWQKAMSPSAYDYDHISETGCLRSMGMITYDNMAEKAEALLCKPLSFTLARKALDSVMDVIPKETMEAERKSLTEFENLWRKQYKGFKKGESLLESVHNGEQPEEKFLKWLDKQGEDSFVFLPNWLIWGMHTSFDKEKIEEKFPECSRRVRVNSSNDWMLAANLAYGSFNMRVAAFLVWAVERGNVEESSMKLFIETVERFCEAEHFGLDSTFHSKSFPDRDGFGPQLGRVLKAATERAEFETVARKGTGSRQGRHI